MWALRPHGWQQENLEGNNRVWYIIGNDITRSVGRRAESDPDNKIIYIPGDKSVSRQHAIISTDSTGTLSILDLSSRYGTFVWCNSGNEFKQISPNQKHELQHNQQIRFGALHNVWKIERLRFTTCTSTCKFDNQALSLLKSMFVEIVPNWTPECTHLTMSSITLTIKVLFALVSERPIIAPTFWSHCHKCIEDDLPLPDVKDHLPPILEPTLNQQTADFGVDPSRKKIFAGKCFVFFSSLQMEKYKYVIENASGKLLLMNDSISKSDLCLQKYIVIQCEDGEFCQRSRITKSIFEDVVKYMKKKSLRIIPEAEIGLSILTKSLNKFCNPLFNFSAEIFKPQEKKNMIEAYEIFAGETEPIVTDKQENDFIRIEESFLSSSKSNQQTKNTENSSNEEKITRKTKRSSLTLEADEPPKKKIEKNNEKSSLDEEPIFNFKNNNVSKNDKLSEICFGTSLNIKGKNIKKRTDVLNVEEGDLFNFISNKTQQTSENKKKRFLIDNDEANYSKKKKICLSDMEEGESSKRNDKESVDGVVKSKNKFLIKFENIEWISSKKPSVSRTIKQQNVEGELDYSVEEKMKMLELKPAVVIINNNLIKKEARVSNDSTKSSNSRNFKKFIKIQHAISRSGVISRNQLSLYESQPNKTSEELRRYFNNDEDEDQFSLVDHDSRKTKSFGRTRRL